MGCDCSPRWFIEERQYVSQERGTCSAKSIFTGMLLVSFTNPLVLSEAGNLSCCLGCSSFINLSRMFHVAETFRSLQSDDVDLVRMWTRRGNSLFFRSFRNLIKRNICQIIHILTGDTVDSSEEEQQNCQQISLG